MPNPETKCFLPGERAISKKFSGKGGNLNPEPFEHEKIEDLASAARRAQEIEEQRAGEPSEED